MILYHWATGYFAPEYWATGYWQYSIPVVPPVVSAPIALDDSWEQIWPEPWWMRVTEDDDELVILMAASKIIKDLRRR